MYLCKNYVEAVLRGSIRCFVRKLKIFMNFFIIHTTDFAGDFQTLVWRTVIHAFGFTEFNFRF